MRSDSPATFFTYATAMLALGMVIMSAIEYQNYREMLLRMSVLENEIKQTALVTTPRAPNTGAGTPSLTASIAKASPAVVSITVSEDFPSSDYGSIFDMHLPGMRDTIPQEVAAGSGFFIRSDGYILTNKHVIIDSKAHYTVELQNGIQKNASIVYTDPNVDVAILKVSGTGYPTAQLGDSSALQLGQSVAAIGNALGQFNNSVSVGVVSGLNRDIQAYGDVGQAENLNGLIQTDIAINPGNSGGPLLDEQGNVVGMNVAETENANNIAFAIPINDVRKVVANILH